MKKIILMAALFVLALPGCGQAAGKLEDHDMVPVTITRAKGEPVTLNIEMALSPEAQTTGLMFRTAMSKDDGMLFVFPHADERAFWMRNTLIPLDIIFLRRDGRILNIHEKAVPLDETPVRSEGPSNAVLEINGGRAAELGLKPGDVVHHPFLANKLAH